jgi:flagellar motor protein MotB
MMKASRGVGVLNRLILLVFLIIVAIIVVAYFLSPGSPFRTQAVPTPAPVTVGQIQKLYRLQTAEVTGQTIVQGETSSALPFSKATISYQVIMTMTAGIDLSQLKDSDIRSDGETLTVTLPQPVEMGETTDFIPIAENKEVFAGPSEKKELPKLVVDEGKNRIRTTIREQGQLMKEAKANAEDELRNLIFQIAPQYKRVVFVYGPQPSPNTTAKPSPTGPPR